jgi:hypothetical protein
VKRLSIALVCATGMLWAIRPADVAAADDASKQIAQLYQLQTNFHRAASVHDWRNGDSQYVIDQRIIEMLDLWSPGGTIRLAVGGPNDGFYDYRGAVSTPTDVADETLCPRVDGVVGGPRGTLCTFFRYVAGSFQLPNRLASLAPAYRTQFEVFGRAARVYFECHYFNVAPATTAASPWPPTAGLPVWAPTGGQNVASGWAIKQHGDWLFYYLNAPLATDAFVPDDVVPSAP